MGRILERLEGALRPVAVLEDQLRRRIYAYVRERGAPVSREEVAASVGISRKLAAFHLDKLLDRGLLTAHYARPPGRSGPGAGRTSKMYEASDLELELSIPERRYDLAGELLVDAIETESSAESSCESAYRVARARGTALGRDVRASLRLRRPGPERTLAVSREVLERQGFEPYEARPGELALRNCPFHSLARRAPDLVCEMNRNFVDGLVRGLGNERVESVLDRAPGECCVRLRTPAARADDARVDEDRPAPARQSAARRRS
jgi:predicted ArsR family transcriptional regulator